MGQKSPAALLPDISFVTGGKRRGFCRLCCLGAQTSRLRRSAQE